MNTTFTAPEPIVLADMRQDRHGAYLIDPTGFDGDPDAICPDCGAVMVAERVRASLGSVTFEYVCDCGSIHDAEWTP